MTALNLQLSVQLQRSLEQVVTAREEERRRHRDIHDGLGPVLAAGRCTWRWPRGCCATTPTGPTRSCRRSRRISRLKVDVEADGDLEPLPAAVEVAAFHIVLEALTNVVRHAAATRCQVRLWRDLALLVEVRDDGRGLPDSYRAGVGLGSIRERAGQLGGSATITAGSGGGTVVQARLPLPAG